ncbi:MAG: dihydroorotate dehydrogenase [Candidatus Omnitrophica bacterium]|nr:dihydroorotate dehydrogenase [Candidatus Omnitrophota bacterium]
MTDLKTRLGSLTFKNPITVASGTFGSKDEFSQLIDYNTLGAVITKSVSLELYKGNSMPRTCETPSGMLNAIGLQNAGVDDFIANKIPYFTTIDVVLIVSIAGRTIDEYVALTERLSEIERVDAIEVNISCPNVHEGGLSFALDFRATQALVRAVKKVTKKPLIIKLSPEGDIAKSAQTAVDAGADMLSLINTVRGMMVDIKTRKPMLANVTGGLSGPAIRPIAIRCLYEVRKCVDVPIIAMGGIASVEDVIEFLIVGANAVSLGTINFAHPSFAGRVIKELEQYCVANKIACIEEIIGTLEL